MEFKAVRSGKAIVKNPSEPVADVLPAAKGAAVEGRLVSVVHRKAL